MQNVISLIISRIVKYNYEILCQVSVLNKSEDDFRLKLELVFNLNNVILATSQQLFKCWHTIYEYFNTLYLLLILEFMRDFAL